MPGLGKRIQGVFEMILEARDVEKWYLRGKGDSNRFFAVRSTDLVLEPGEHTLTFQGRTDGSQDSTLFLDDVSLRKVSPIHILPIPNQSCAGGGACRPEFTVTNLLDATAWTLGGDIVSPLFDVEYTDNAALGIAAVTVTGKGACAGLYLLPAVRHL